MGQIRAVAFDFDETLSDWPAAVERAVTLLANEPPLANHDGFVERFLRLAGELYPSRTPGALYFEVHKVFEAAIGDSGDSHDLADRFRSRLTAVPFADVAPTVPALAEHFDLAVLSNNPYAPEGLRVMGLADYFPTVIALREDSGLAKPHPHAFRSLVHSLELGPEEVAFVGDSIDDDIQGALATGLVAIWLDRFATSSSLPLGAHRIESLTELPPLLERL
jgi:putative hydrolase of the HAD superfamily